MGACKVTDSKNSLAFKLIGILALAICLLVAFRTGQDKLGYHVDDIIPMAWPIPTISPFRMIITSG